MPPAARFNRSLPEGWVHRTAKRSWLEGPQRAGAPSWWFALSVLTRHEFRARYRDDGEKYFEYRIRRIDGHDEDNVEIGEDLVEWTRAEGVDAEEWIKWEIRFRSSGHLYVKADNREQPAYARDNKFSDQRYFGLLARTNEKTDALVHFDKFEISKED